MKKEKDKKKKDKYDIHYHVKKLIIKGAFIKTLLSGQPPNPPPIGGGYGGGGG